jgi:hypothetical protein
MINRRECLGLLGAAAVAAAPRPNFVVLLADDQRWDTIAALGNKRIRTPNLDRLASRGVAFTNAYIMGGTMGAVCSPSRAMLLAGQNLFHIRRLTSPPDAKAPEREFHMWPEVLRKAGYTTWATGKWHNPPALHARCFSQGANVFLGGMGDQFAMPLRPFSTATPRRLPLTWLSRRRTIRGLRRGGITTSTPPIVRNCRRTLRPNICSTTAR